MSIPLEDYALIGDCETAALVSYDGSIDWLCWPRFDSDAVFAALLGTHKNGRWLIAARDNKARIKRRYRDDTLILETSIETRTGAVTLIDFMPPRGKNSDVVRMVRGERGHVDMHTELILRFNYGSAVPWVNRLSDGTIRAIAGPDMVTMRTPVKLIGKSLTTLGEFTVKKGDVVPFVLTHGPSHLAPPRAINPRQALRDTETFWRKWARDGDDAGTWNEPVTRSLITLKALTYAPTGGLVASPTTSIPEQLGGVRNWDYRFCWLRDATLALLALMNAGHYDEAQAWRDWLLRAAAGSPSQIQIMYGLAGERRLTEYELPGLPGYEKSQPVRIGNMAHGQLQLDVYGEVMDALHQACRGGMKTTRESWNLQLAMLDHLADVWTQPDQGIWEVRGEHRQFTYSRVMAWVAFDRAIRSVEEFGYKGPVSRWRKMRKLIHEDVCKHGFNRSMQSFVQSYGARNLDASLLLMPTVGFLKADDPRIVGTVRAIEKRLVVDGFVQRYDTDKTDDGLPAGEGVFLACSFWLADVYVLMQRHDDARRLFERLLALRNDLGLLAEEYDTRAKRMVGNFPQAFSHVALVNTAHNLAFAEKPARQRSTPNKTPPPGSEPGRGSRSRPLRRA
jgi:GH15 family glucan-1,4-alpha-glucosidase